MSALKQSSNTSMILLQSMPKNSKKQNIHKKIHLHFFIVPFLFLLIQQRKCFQFKSPTVTANPLTINTQSSYTFTMYRQFDQNIQTTPWSSEPVPLDANITIAFPSEYTLTGNQECNYIMFNYVSSFSFSCTVDTAAKKIIISNSITSQNQQVSDFLVQLSKIMNPTPVQTTSPFIVTIGQDISGTDPLAAVTLQPGELQQTSLTFDPPTVNVTSNLLISFKPTNDLPINSKIKVSFPSSLQWARDISTNHQLPIEGILSCSGISSNLDAGIECSGLVSTQQVTIFNFNPNFEIISGELIEISINNLFTPPTEESIDSLSITTVVESGNTLDFSTSRITGLVAKQFSFFTISKLYQTKYINSNIGLIFEFELEDTLGKTDDLEMRFPVGTIINYQTSVTSLSLTNVTYNQNTGILSFKQNTNSQIRYAGANINITFILFTTPPSTKPIDVSFLILNSGYAKMKGTQQFSADFKSYSATVTPTSLKINSRTNLSVALTLADQLLATGYFVATLPTELIDFTSSIAVSITSTTSGINTNPTIDLAGNILTITNLNKTSTATGIPIQMIIITIQQFTMPASVQTLTPFQMDIYYSNENYQTARAIQSNTIITEPGEITEMQALFYVSGSIIEESMTNRDGDLLVRLRVENRIEENGCIEVEIGDLELNGSLLCNVVDESGGAIVTGCIDNSPIIKIEFISRSISGGQLLAITLSKFKTPISTYQSQSIMAKSYSSNNNLIDQNIAPGPTLQMSTIPKTSTTFSILHQNQINLQTNTITMSVSNANLNLYPSDHLGLSLTNYLFLALPSEIGYVEGESSLLRVSNGVDTQIIEKIEFGQIESSSNVKFTCFAISLEEQTQSFSQIIKFTNIINPPSFKPTDTGIAYFLGFTQSAPTSFPVYLLQLLSVPSSSVTDTGIFFYSWDESSYIQNTDPAPIPQLQYSFSNHQILGNSQLLINYVQLPASSSYPSSENIVGLFKIELASDLSLLTDSNSAPFLSVCQVYSNAVKVESSCNIVSSPPTIQITPSLDLSIKNTITIKLKDINNPSQVLPSYEYTQLSVFTSDSYLISQSLSSITFTPKCDLPCLDCIELQGLTQNVTKCLACFLPGNGITASIYYLEDYDQNGDSLGYGQCMENCPEGFFISLLNLTNICQPCQQPCLTCQNSALQCTACDENSTNNIYYNQDCVSQCPNGTFMDESGVRRECSQCSSPCGDCVSANECLSCQDPYFYYQATMECLESCPQNITVQNQINGICEQCIEGCTQCSESIDYCISCQTGQYLFNGTCVQECPNFNIQQMVIINQECFPCIDSCLKCLDLPDNCSSCKQGMFLHEGQCLQQCPPLYINANAECLLCSDKVQLHCSNCSVDGLSCYECDQNYLLFEDIQLNTTSCIDSAPDGFIIIDGEVVKCVETCLDCALQIDNCTACELPLYLYQGQCIEVCPQLTAPSADPPQCLSCEAPCLQCESSIIQCSSCQPGYIFDPTKSVCYSQNETNIEDLCPENYFVNFSTGVCEQCGTQCAECEFSSANCSICDQGFLFISSSGGECLDQCPPGWLGQVNTCNQCINHCDECSESLSTCTSCDPGYYFRQSTQQCLQKCPQNITITSVNQSLCLECSNQCSECLESIDNCLSCSSAFYEWVKDEEIFCLANCPPKFYKSQTQKSCDPCPDGCLLCQNSTFCQSCSAGFYFYSNFCFSSCPSSSFYPFGSQCVQCVQTIQGCKQCTISESLILQCLACDQTQYFLMQKLCLTECPDGYIEDTTSDIKKCVTIDQNTDKILDDTLTSGSIFPMPFTCIGLGLVIAIFMSKLQNKNTYLIGAVYAFFGILETVSLGYLIKNYYDQKSVAAEGRRLETSTDYLIYEEDKMLLLLIGLGIIYLINLIGLVSQTPILLLDEKFQQWNKNCCNKAAFGIVTLLSFLINYKIKLLIFSKMFSFTWARSKLQSVQKFRIFNIMSFLGASHQIFIIYVCVVMLLSVTASSGSFNPFSTPIFLTFIDTAAICLISIVFSIASNKKDDTFFEELEDNGYVLNKKVRLADQDFSREAIGPRYLIGDENRLNQDNMQSHDVIKPEVEQEVVYEDEQISLSMSDNRSEIKSQKSERVEKKIKNKQSQTNDNFLSKSRLSNASKRDKRPQNLHKFQDQTSQDLRKQQLRGETSSEERSNQNDEETHSVGRSMILHKKEQKEEEGIKKNKTTLFQPQQKNPQIISDKKFLEKGQEIQKTKENIFEKQKNLREQYQNHKDESKIKDQGERQVKQSQSHQQQIQSRQNNKANQSPDKNSQKPFHLKKSPQTKVYSRVRKPSGENVDGIEAMIRNKQAQLLGLKKSSSRKDLQSQLNQTKSNQKNENKEEVRVSKKTLSRKKNIFEESEGSNKSQSEVESLDQGENEEDKQGIEREKKLDTDSKIGKKSIRENSTLINLVKNQEEEDKEIKRREKEIEDNGKKKVTENIEGTQSKFFDQKEEISTDKLEVEKETYLEDKDNEYGQKMQDLVQSNYNNESKLNERIFPLTHEKEQQIIGEQSALEEKPKKKTEEIDENFSKNFSVIQNQQTKSGRIGEKLNEDFMEFKQETQENQEDEEKGESAEKSSPNKSGEKKIQKLPENMFDSIVRQSLHYSAGRYQQSQGKKKIQESNQLFTKNPKKNTENQNRSVIKTQNSFQEITENALLNKNSEQKKKNYKMFELQEELERELDDDIVRDSEKDNKFQQSESGLEDSRPDGDQSINHRPLQSSFARSQSREGSRVKGEEKNMLIGILQKNAQKKDDHGDLIKDINNRKYKNQSKSKRRIGEGDDQEEDIKEFSRFTSEDQTVRFRNEMPPMQKNNRPSTTDKSRMYFAGMRQLEQGTLTKKGNSNHPLGRSRQKSNPKNRFNDDSDGSEEMVPYLYQKEKDNRKNKSLYNVQMKKQQSQSISNNDEIQFNTAYGSGENSLHNQALLTRYHGGQSRIGSSTINPDRVNQSPQKPLISETARLNFDHNDRKMKSSYEKKRKGMNITSYEGKISTENDGQDDNLREYYGSRIGKRISHESIEKSPARSKKSKSGSKDRHRDSSKRMKDLQKIYLQRLEGPKRS